MAAPAWAFDFVSGQFFTTAGFLEPDYPVRTVRRYSATGQYVESLSLPSGVGTPDAAHGLSFGPDGLLYVVSIDYSGTEVVALHRTGVVARKYSAPQGYGGSAASGKIVFSADGNFFVTTGLSILRFSSTLPSGVAIYSDSEIEALAALPSGNLLVLTRFSLKEITASGTVVRTISPSVTLYDAISLAYDAQSDSIYVGMIQGDSVIRIAAADGVLLNQATVPSPFDIRITKDRSVVVTSRYGNPKFHDITLQSLGVFGGVPQLFIAEVPSALPEIEPCSLDVDGNAKIDYATDGLLILRAMLGFSDAALVANATGSGPARRDTAVKIRLFLRDSCGLQLPW